MLPTASTRCRNLIALLTGVVLAGCGAGDYRSRMLSREAELQKSEQERPLISLADFTDYMPPEDAPLAGQIRFRVPLIFKTVFHEQIRDQNTGKTYSPQLLYPGGVELPGYDRTYEALVDVASIPEGMKSAPGKQLSLPYYLYVAARQQSEAEFEREAAVLLAAFHAEFPDGGATWRDVRVMMSDGQTEIPWKQLRLEGNFYFDQYVNKTHSLGERSPGVIEIMACHKDGFMVVIGYKVPKPLAETSKMNMLLPAMASTLKIEPAEPAAPNPAG